MRDEARILGRLSHRHIVGVSDLVRLQERWAVVMDYVPGADLERVLEALAAAGEQFPVRAAFDVAVAVLRALHAAWIVDNGTGSPLHLIHRDIKPSNVLLAEDGALKVLDFGVARVDLGTREAETGAVRPGTLRYMAPERLLGEEESPSGDVYATAVSVFELLIGEPLGRTPIIDPKHTAYVEGAVQRAKERAKKVKQQQAKSKKHEARPKGQALSHAQRGESPHRKHLQHLWNEVEAARGVGE